MFGTKISMTMETVMAMAIVMDTLKRGDGRGDIHYVGDSVFFTGDSAQLSTASKPNQSSLRIQCSIVGIRQPGEECFR